MDTGWIKIHRRMIKWEWYSDGNTFRVFMHLLLTANYEDSRYKGYLIPRGSVVIGRHKLAKTLAITEQSVRTAINHLKSTNEITIKVTNRFSIATIVNYDFYQDIDDEVTNKSTSNLTPYQPTTNQQLTTSKEVKNIRSKEIKNNILSENSENDKLAQHDNIGDAVSTSAMVLVANIDSAPPEFSEFWQAYPRKTQKVVAEKAWNKLKDEEKFVALEKIDDFCKGKEMQFIAHPSTYINQKRWEDEVIEPTKKVEQTSVSKQYVPERDDWV